MRQPWAGGVPERIHVSQKRYEAKKSCFFAYFIGVAHMSLPVDSHNGPRGQNRLAEEKSPYLQQHRNNPVWWWPWGEEAFECAKRFNIPIFLSIGYSTCHWCHVMEHESFEDAEVARFLNAHFVAIKVDREELPDVDRVYMNALQAMTGHGGWPLSAFLTSSGEPFYTGTYFPKETFLNVLAQITNIWKEDQSKIIDSAKNIRAHLASAAQSPLASSSIDDNTMAHFVEQSEKTFDPVHGGFGSAPKFPPPMRLRLLMRIYQRSGYSPALEMVERTLHKMANGGIFDHLGGGFHRYSVDSQWLVPHFEKMLYDNALLASCYLEAFQLTKNPIYKRVATKTLDYVLREMSSASGGYFSAEDADSEGEEGRFYVWTESELRSLLNEHEFDSISRYYGITSAGNFEHGTNILFVPDSTQQAEGSPELVNTAKEKLLAYRESRPRPLRDTKIITAWNGLMISAMALAYQVTGKEDYLLSAQNAALFLQGYLWNDAHLYRRYMDNEAKFPGTLDDYAFLIAGLIELYQADFDEGWISWARELQAKQEELFSAEGEFGYHYSSEELILPIREYYDSAEPNPNAISALNLLKLYSLTLHIDYKERAMQILLGAPAELERAPSAYSSLLLAANYLLTGPKEVVVIPSESEGCRSLFQDFAPHIVVSSSNTPELSSLKILQAKLPKTDERTFFVCEEHHCQLPVSSLREAQIQIHKIRKMELS